MKDMPYAHNDKEKDKNPNGGGKEGGDKLAELEATGRPLVDEVNRMAGEEPGKMGGAAEAQPLVDALQVSPEHAKRLLEAARAEGSPYKDMTPQDLADKLAGDAEARADLERRVEASKGAPKPKAPGKTPIGGESETGIAAWPGSPAAGQPAAAPSDLGVAKWPGM